MIITVASFKGGVGKSTTALHLAAYFAKDAVTIVVDGDPNRSITSWARKGKLPFQVVDERQAARAARECKHLIVDTKARPEPEDLKALALGCDVLIIPTTPDPLALDALMLTLSALRMIGSDRFRILLTIVPPKTHSGRGTRSTGSQKSLPAALSRRDPPDYGLSACGARRSDRRRSVGQASSVRLGRLQEDWEGG